MVYKQLGKLEAAILLTWPPTGETGLVDSSKWP